MSQEAFFADVVRRVQNAGVPFMVTGSYGSTFHGRPRATNDLDLVIDPTPAQLEALVAALGDCYYVSPDAAREALARRSMFNIIDFGSGWKADMIIRKDRAFSVEEFGRQQKGTLHGLEIPIATPEDVVLSKLEWNKITPSERQLQDAFHVAQGKWLSLDQEYLRKWAPVLGVAEQLETILQKAKAAQGPAGP